MKEQTRKTPGLLRVAWFSDLTTNRAGELDDEVRSRSKSSYVSKRILPYLAEEVEIELFHNSFDEVKNFKAFHYLNAGRRHRERPFDFFIHNIEDSVHSQWGRIALGMYPGVAWYHDILFSSAGPEPILNSPWEESSKLFRQIVDGSQFPLHWPSRDNEYFKEEHFAHRELSYGWLPIFSEPYLHRMFHEQKAASHPARNSYYLGLPARESDFTISDSNLGDGVGYLGGFGVEDRSYKVLEALSNVEKSRAAPVPFYWLVPDGHESQARTLVEEYGLRAAEIVPGRSPENWSKILPKLALALHTRFSVFGSSSPFLAQSLAAGRLVVTTAFDNTDHLPDGVVARIDPGVQEALQLQLTIESLLTEQKRVSNSLAMEYAREFFSERQIAQDLLSILTTNQSAVARYSSSWAELNHAARNEVIREVKEFSNPPLFEESSLEGIGVQTLFQRTQEEFVWEK